MKDEQSGYKTRDPRAKTWDSDVRDRDSKNEIRM